MLDGRKHFHIILALLESAPDKIFTVGEMVSSLWPDPEDEPDWAETIVRRTLADLRQAGVRIEVSCRVGYSLQAKTKFPRQMQILHDTLQAAAGRVQPLPMLLEAIQGSERKASENLVRVQISRLRPLIAPNEILNVHGTGYVYIKKEICNGQGGRRITGDYATLPAEAGFHVDAD